MRTILLGKRGSFRCGDTLHIALDQFGKILAELCCKRVFGIIQTVQLHAMQQTYIDGCGGHDVLDEHVCFITTGPLASISSIVLAVILATANQLVLIDGVLGLLMAKLLERTAAEDVYRRIIAVLSVDDDTILFLGFPDQIHVDDWFNGKAAVVHHVAGGIVAIAQALQLDLFFGITFHQQVIVDFRLSFVVCKVVGTGGQRNEK